MRETPIDRFTSVRVRTLSRNRRVTCCRWFMVVALIALAGATPAASQSVPTRIPFQGLLLDSGGAVVTGSVNLDFELFDGLTAGTSLWSETQLGTIVVDGVYSVELGAVTPLGANVVSGGAAFLEITVDGETLAPRQQLLSVPYALRAESVGSASSLLLSQMAEGFAFDGGDPPNLDPREGHTDTDGDGVPNFLDPDNDGDGIDDSVELSLGNDINIVSPTISSTLPARVQSFASTTLVATGSRLSTLQSVSFGAESPTPRGMTDSSFTIDVLTETPAGNVVLAVTLANGETGSLIVGIDRVAPTITSISPPTASPNQTTVLTITGTGFYPGTTVRIGTQDLIPSSLTDTEIVVTMAPEPISELPLSVVHPNTLEASQNYLVIGNTPKVAFLTSGVVSTGWGSLASYDARCQSEAVANGISGTFRAWMSNSISSASPSSPATTHSRSGSPYVRVDGAIIAVDWSDLTDGTLQVPINITSDGRAISTRTWTGTAIDGTASEPTSATTCSDWSSRSDTYGGRTGRSSYTGSTWSEYDVIDCDTDRRIYCFEQ